MLHSFTCISSKWDTYHLGVTITISARHLPFQCDKSILVRHLPSQYKIYNLSETLTISVWQLQSQRDTYYLSVTFTISVRHLPSRCGIFPRRPCGHSVWSPGLSESCWACCSSPAVWPQSCAATTKTAPIRLHSQALTMGTVSSPSVKPLLSVAIIFIWKRSNRIFKKLYKTDEISHYF